MISPLNDSQPTVLASPTSLPPGWTEATLGELFRWGSGGTPLSTNPSFYDGDIPWAIIGDLNDGVVNSTQRTISKLGLENSSAKLVEAGTVLIAMYGSIGKLGLAGIPMATNQAIAFTKPDHLEARFLFWFLRSIRDDLFHLGKGGTQRNISQTVLKSIRMPVPPLAEQRRIVAEIETQFTRLDAAVAALERARANLKRYRAAVLETCVSGPWPTAPLAEVSVIQGGIQKQPKRAPVSNAYPFLRVANVHRGRLDLADVHQVELFAGELERLRLEKDDLLVVEGNGSQSEIGRMAIWDGSIQDCVHQNHLIRIRLNEELQSEFVEAYWNSPSGQRAVQSVASSTSGLYTLSVRKIGQLTVPIPPLDSQKTACKEIARQVSVVDELAATAQENGTRVERLRQSILQKAFAGELVPHCPDDEAASVLVRRIREERKIISSTKKQATTQPRRKSMKLEAQRVLL